MIDTAAKRQSALTFRQICRRGLIPDGTIDQADRQTIAYSYGGILAGAYVPVITQNVRLFIHNHNRMGLR